MAIDDNIANVTTTEMTAYKQLGFMTALPSEIVQEIFQYLNQQDCLRSMTVCRDWDVMVPQYTKDIWRELRLNVNDASRDYRRRERCLGDHVQSVILESIAEEKESALYIMMRKVHDWGCHGIESLELKSWSIKDQDAFVDSSRCLSARLSHLKLTDCRVHVLIPHILGPSPNLTHLAIKACIFRANRLEGQLSSIPFDNETKITHLWLDSDIGKEQVDWLLEHCPRLRCFVGESKTLVGMHPYTPYEIDLDSLFSLCPDITFYADHETSTGGAQDPDYYLTSGRTGLCYFKAINARNKLNQVAQRLTESSDMLEYVSLEGQSHDGYDWSFLFQSLRMPNLRTLAFAYLSSVFADTGSTINNTSLVALLNHCPILETLNLAFNNGLTLDSFAIQSLHPMDRLSCLCLKGIRFDPEHLLGPFLERFPALRDLALKEFALSIEPLLRHQDLGHLTHIELSSYLGNGCFDDTKIAHFLESIIGSSNNLESIIIPASFSLGPESLQLVAAFPSLKYLEVPPSKSLQEEELLEFIRALGDTTVIEHLTLKIDGYLQLSTAICTVLANLPFLQFLEFQDEFNQTDAQSGIEISKDDLFNLLRSSSSLKIVSFHALEIQDGDSPLLRDYAVQLMEEELSCFKFSHEECDDDDYDDDEYDECDSYDDRSSGSHSYCVTELKLVRIERI